MLYLAVYWDQFPEETVEIVKYTRAGIKYEQVPTELFVVDVDDIKKLPENTILIPYNNERYIYIITEYAHNKKSEIKDIIKLLNQNNKIYNYDNTNIILTDIKITNVGIYNFSKDAFYLNDEIIESDELQGDMKEADFNIKYDFEEKEN